MFKQIYRKYLPRIVGSYINTLAVIAPKKAGRKAMNIFCTPRAGRLRPQDEATLAGFTRVQLNCEGLAVQCYVKGTGATTILLAHGWESNAARWKRLFPLLEKHPQFRLVAIDGPAHGLSGGKQFNSPLYARFIKTACDHFRPDILVGHSIGAASMVFYLTHLPALPVQKLVMMGSPSDFSDIADDFIRILGLQKRARKAMLNQFSQTFNMEPGYYSIKTFAKQLTVRGLVVHDRADAVTRFSDAEKIVQNWPNSALLPVEGAGHSLNNREVLKQVEEFILS